MYMANARILRFGPNRNLYSTDSCWGFALGPTQILAFFDANMLIYPMRNCGVGGLSQCKDLTQMVLRCSGIKALCTLFNTLLFLDHIKCLREYEKPETSGLDIYGSPNLCENCVIE